MNSKDNINEENEEFNIPEGYFESFNDRLMKRIEAADELRDYPTLYKLDNIIPYIVPEQYFENFEARLQERLEVKEAKVFDLRTFTKKYRYVIAAVFVMALGIGVLFKYESASQQIQSEEPCMDLACLSKEDIMNSKYFENLGVRDLETLAGQEIQDSIKNEINDDVIKELLQHPEDLDLNDEDVEF